MNYNKTENINIYCTTSKLNFINMLNYSCSTNFSLQINRYHDFYKQQIFVYFFIAEILGVLIKMKVLAIGIWKPKIKTILIIFLIARDFSIIRVVPYVYLLSVSFYR